ncbi:hypothetical protein D3C86_1715790 [compost metagenome]
MSHCRDAWQFLAKIVGIAFAVVRRMQDAVDVIEHVLLADLLAGIETLEVGQPCIGDGVSAF